MNHQELLVEEMVTALTKKQTTQLARHVDFPSINREQISWLIDVAQNETLAWQSLVKGVHYAQVALLLHERVGETERGSKERQLLVLAGDLFSSYFFEELASLPQTALVTLGRTVQHVNEAKCALHEENYDSTEEYVLLWLKAEFGLVQGLATISGRDWLTEDGQRLIRQRARSLQASAQQLLLSHLEQMAVA